MAEYMLRDRLGLSSGWEVSSAGVSAVAGIPVSRMAVEVLTSHDIDISDHASRPVTRELVDAASLIVVMTVSHREQMAALFSDARGKIFLLKSFDSAADGKDVDDPIGLSVDIYHGIYREIDAALPGLIEFMEKLDS